MESKDHSEHLIFILFAACLLLVGLWWLSSGHAWGQALTETMLSNEPVWSVNGTDQGDQFGYSVASGDLNGDGVQDMLIGAPKDELNVYREGTLNIFFTSAGGLPASPDRRIGGGQQGAAFGASLVVTDLDKDGFAEIIVGAPLFANPFNNSGKVFIYKRTQISGDYALVWEQASPEPEARYAQALGSGDFNGDGYDDLIVGAPHYKIPETDMPTTPPRGAAYVYYGTADLAALPAEPGWELIGVQAGEYLGSSVAGVGDVNGDGFDDLLVGAPRYDTADLENAGRILLYLGSATGLSDTSAWSDIGVQADANLGSTVSAAGDINRDGYADFSVRNVHEVDGLSYGQVLTFYGDFCLPDKARMWSFTIEQENTCFGCALAAAGDVNGDHYPDLIVGDEQYNYLLFDDGEGLSSLEGAAFVFLGAPTGLSGNIAWIGYGRKSDATFGFSIASAGDINGDGFSDVLIGGPEYKTGGDPVGRAELYLGSAAEAVIYRFQVLLPMVTSH